MDLFVPTSVKVLSIKDNISYNNYKSYKVKAYSEAGETILLFFKDDLTDKQFEQVNSALYKEDGSYSFQYGCIETINDKYVICKTKDNTLFKAYGEITKAGHSMKYAMKVVYNFVNYICVIPTDDEFDTSNKDMCVYWDYAGHAYLKTDKKNYRLSLKYTLKEDNTSIQANSVNIEGVDPYHPQFIEKRKIRDQI